MPPTLDLDAKLNGYFASDFVNDNSNDAPRECVGPSPHASILKGDEAPSVAVSDARSGLQGGQLTRENGAKVFQEKGFCCLPHSTKVQDWNEDYFKGKCMYVFDVGGSDISNVYAFEVEELIRNVLLKDYNVIDLTCHNGVLKRGPDSKNNFYGSGVHQDYGLTLADFLTNLNAYDPSGFGAKSTVEKFNNPEVKRFMVINFWRPIGPEYTADTPLLTKPLALCDPASVATEETVHTGLDAGAVQGREGTLTDQMALKYSDKHKWYYYPRMTSEEVLVFKQIDISKDDPQDRSQVPVRGVFHTAFEDPTTPEGSPPRRSCEYRVVVYVGDKKNKAELEEEFVIPAPLFPKEGKEWGLFVLDLAVIGVIPPIFSGECPAIPSIVPFVLCFAGATILSSVHKFYYGLRRPNQQKLYPLAANVNSFLGILQLAFGIWGIAIIFPNLGLFSDPSPETCETGPLIVGLIPSAIIAVVIVGIIGAGIYYGCFASSSKKEPEPESAN